MDRLQKLLSAAGLCSRRTAEAWIAAGRVTVNGEIAVLGQSADPDRDRILVDGRPLPAAPLQTRTILLYKPRGVVTTLSDEKGRPTVLSLLPSDMPRLYPVGRLDYFSEGLLLMTNDGDLTQRLTHPGAETEKVYELWVSGFVPEAAALLRRPIELDGSRIRPPKVRLLWQRDGVARLEITIHEGRNRQIRRMCQAAGLTVTRLKRVREGPISLGDLKPGQWRELTAAELAALNPPDRPAADDRKQKERKQT